MTAVSTLSVEINAQKSIVTLEQIKQKMDAGASAFDRLHKAASGGFDRVVAALGRLESPLQKIIKEMEAMRSGMTGGAAAALKQAGAMDRLAKSVKTAEAAQAKQAAANRNELADLKALEAAANRKLSLELRIGRQLGENAELQNRLTAAVSKYDAVITKSGANSLAGVKAKGELQREFSRVSSEIARMGGLLPKLNEIKDAIPQKKGASRLTAADKAMMAAWAPDMAQQAIASGGNILTPMLVQAPELAQIFSRLGASTKLLAGGFAGVATAVGVVVAAMSRLSDQQQSLRDLGVIIRATGQAGTLAAKDLAALADHINLLPSVSREAAEKTVQNLARIRGLGSAGIQGAAMLGPDFARAIGESDIAKATAQLGKSLSDPAKGARELNEALGFLSAGQLISIERMAQQGKRAEALQAVLSKLRLHLDGLAREGMSPLAAATDRLGNSFDHLMSVIANSSAVVALMEKMANAAQNVANALNGPAWKWVLGSAAMANPATMPMALRSITQVPEPKLSLPMPPPLAQTAQAAGGGTGGALAKAAGTSDAEKELSDVLALTDGYRSWRGQAEQLRDTLERVRRAQALTTDKDVLARLRQSEEGIVDQLRQAVDPKAKLVADSQRGARNEWRIADADWTDRDRLRTIIEGENAAREAGLSAMQREDLIRSKLSEAAARYMTSVQDSVRTMGYQVDATERLAAVENGSIMDRQRVADVLQKEEFRRQALAKATAENRDQILNEVSAFDQLIDRMGKASTASQFKSAAMSYSPTMQYEAFKKDAPGIEEAMRQGGATQDEITKMYEDSELRKLDASRRWEDGVTRGLKRVQSDALDFARHSETAITNSLSTVEDAFVQMAQTGKLNFQDMARSIIGDLIRIQTRMSITAPLAGAMNGLFGGLFGGGAKTGAGGAGAPTSLMPGEWSQGQLTPRIGDFYAKGGAFSPMGKLHAFARGGTFTNSVVDHPTMFAFAKGGALGLMGEAGPEAIMPLQRGPDGRLGVAAMGGGGGTVNNIEPHISVTVEGSASSGDSEMDERQAQRIAKAVDGQIRATVVSELQRQMRGGGMLNRV